jgi:hypothetical protein
MSVKLSANNLKALPAGQISWDSDVAGFGARKARNGAVTLFLNYQVRATGKYRRHTIGRLGELSVDAARKRAATLRLEIRTGIDPAQKAETAVVKAKRSDTLGEYVEQWLTSPKHKWSPMTLKAYRNTIRRGLVGTPEADIPIGDIRRADLMRLVDAATDVSASSGALFYRALGSFLGYADDRDLTEARLPRASRVAPPSEPRTRVMSDAEIGALWASVGALPAALAATGKLMLLTVQRSGAVQAVQSDWISQAGVTWPAECMKSNREHHTALTPWAHKQVKGAGCAHGRELSQHWAAWRTAAGVDPSLRMHDVRRSFRTWAAAQGFGHDACEVALAHVVQKDALARAYMQHSYADEAGEVLRKWQKHIENMV